MFDSLWLHGLQPARFLCAWNFPGKNTGVGCYFLLKEIFPTQGSNSHLLHLLLWQVDSLPLSHLGRQSLLWVAYNWMLFFFLICSTTSYLLIGEFKSFTFKEITDMEELTIAFFIFYMFCNFFVPLLLLSSFKFIWFFGNNMPWFPSHCPLGIFYIFFLLQLHKIFKVVALYFKLVKTYFNGKQKLCFTAVPTRWSMWYHKLHVYMYSMPFHIDL